MIVRFQGRWGNWVGAVSCNLSESFPTRPAYYIINSSVPPVPPTPSFVLVLDAGRGTLDQVDDLTSGAMSPACQKERKYRRLGTNSPVGNRCAVPQGRYLGTAVCG